jgi:glycosyltransferase involved in cell wall biosynthesis
VRRRPRLLVLSQFYDPEPNFITQEVARRLAADFDVVVLTPQPNYPLDSVYAGTRSPWRATKSIDGTVTVWRLPILAYHGPSRVRRALCYLSFALPAVLLAPFLAGRPKVIWVYLGPFFPALAALPFKLLSRTRLVYTVADLWPESLLAAGVARRGLAVRCLYAYRRLINRAATDIICTTRGTLATFEAEGVPRTRLHFVPVWTPGLQEITDRLPEPPTRDSGRVVYVGNMGPAQRLDTVIEAADILRRRGIGVSFHLYGDGSDEPRLRRMADDRQLVTVQFHGRVPPADAFDVSAAALGQIIILEPAPLFGMTIPSKLSFCCAAGSPLLYGLTGEARALAEASGGGVEFDAASPASLATAVEALTRMSPDERGALTVRLRRFHREVFAPSVLLERTTDIVIGRESQPARDWPTQAATV